MLEEENARIHFFMDNDTNYFFAIFYSIWRIRFLFRLKTSGFFRKVFGAILP